MALSMHVDIGFPSFLPQDPCLSLQLHVIVLPNKTAQTCLLQALHSVELRLRHQGPKNNS